MSASMNDAHDAHDGRIDLVVDGIREAAEEQSAQATVDDGLTPGRCCDRLNGCIDRNKESFGGAR